MGEEEHYGVRRRSGTRHDLCRVSRFVGGEYSYGQSAGQGAVSARDRRKGRIVLTHEDAAGSGKRRREAGGFAGVACRGQSRKRPKLSQPKYSSSVARQTGGRSP